MSQSNSSTSTSSGSGWSRSAVAAAIALPTATLAAAVGYLYYQFTHQSKGDGKKTKKTKKKVTAPSAPIDPFEGSPTADFPSDELFIAALHRDIEGRTRERVNKKLEQRIWTNIRKLTPANVRELTQEARTEIGQWIVAFHANDSLDTDGSGLFVGGPAGTGSTSYHRVALDYDLAWSLFESVESDLTRLPEDTRRPDEEALLKGTQLMMLDLAHKMRSPDKMIQQYRLIRSRNTQRLADGSVDPAGFTESEFFPLWMMSPLIGEWNDFHNWCEFMRTKGETLEEFPRIARQRPDIIDFKELASMVSEAYKNNRVVPSITNSPSTTSSTDSSLPPAFLWHPPTPDELEFSVWNVVGSVSTLLRSSGTSQEDIKRYIDANEPQKEWKSMPLPRAFRKLGACVRIASRVMAQLPVCGPILTQQTTLPSDSSDSSASTTPPTTVPKFECHGTVYLQVAGPAPTTPDTITTTPPTKTHVRQLVESYNNFTLLSDSEAQAALLQFRPKKKSETDTTATTTAAETETESSSPTSATASSSTDSTDVIDSSPLTLDEYDPSSPPQLWRGIYTFEQFITEQVIELDPETHRMTSQRNVPVGEPLVHVEYELILKMTPASSAPPGRA